MRALIKGPIIDYVPYFNGEINEDGVLVLHEGGGRSLIVDTGFSGGIALPTELLAKMDLVHEDYGWFMMGTGEAVQLPVFRGRVMLGAEEFETWFIPGDSLIGMEFLPLLGTRLEFDLERGEVDLY